jgi:hypothetical protein
MPTPAIVAAVVGAINTGDTDAFLALFQEDGSVDDWGSVYRGRQRIKAWSDRELIGAKARFELRSSQQHGDEASMVVEVGGEGFNGPSRFAFTLDGGRISQMRITAS